MNASGSVSEVEWEGRRISQAEPASQRAWYGIYALCIGASIAAWFLAIGAPLWVDETGSYWVIETGFRNVAKQSTLNFPGYEYILWLSAKVLGTREIAMRAPLVPALSRGARLGSANLDSATQATRVDAAVFLLALGVQMIFSRFFSANWACAGAERDDIRR